VASATPKGEKKKKKKKKINPKLAKTTPFWAKRHCFGLAQNGVVLERRLVWTTYHQRVLNERKWKIGRMG
jgi:hypothetical protein